MRKNAMAHVTLLLAVLLIPAGCTRVSGPTEDAEALEQSSGTSGGAAAVAATLAAPLGAYTVTLPEGTPLTVRTMGELSTKTHATGHSFTAHLVQPLFLDGREIVPRGAEVEGRIAGSDKGGRVRGLATLAVQMTRLDSAGGQPIDISTTTVTRTAGATKGEDAAKIGIGSGVGAAIGAIAGGGKGAAIGAAAGAGAGSGVVLATHGDAAVIPSETVLEFALAAPVTIAGSR